MNDDAVKLALVFLTGAILGLVYFGGLWLTLRRIHTAAHPVLLLAVSFAGRTAILLTAFYFVMAGDWERIALCLVGFIVARFAMVRLIRPAKMAQNSGNGIPA